MEGEGKQLVPEGVIGGEAGGASQLLQLGVGGQLTQTAALGTHAGLLSMHRAPVTFVKSNVYQAHIYVWLKNFFFNYYYGQLSWPK